MGKTNTSLKGKQYHISLKEIKGYVLHLCWSRYKIFFLEKYAFRYNFIKFFFHILAPFHIFFTKSIYITLFFTIFPFIFLLLGKTSEHNVSLTFRSIRVFIHRMTIHEGKEEENQFGLGFRLDGDESSPIGTSRMISFPNPRWP